MSNQLTPDQILDIMDDETDEPEKKAKKVAKPSSGGFSDLRMPMEKELKEWFSHIKELEIEIYLIETKIEPKCPYCEAWRQNKRQRKWMRQLHQILGLSENVISFTEVLCDWNCLHATEFYNPVSKRIESYSNEVNEYGDNYFEAFGRDIEYFPAIRIQIISTKYRDAREPLEIVFQGLGAIIQKQVKYKFADKIYTRKVSVLEQNLLKPLIKFLKSLSTEESEMPIHEKFSLFLGQYHRHTD